MKESKFIDQNKEKWAEFEAVFDNKDKDPEKLSDLFIEVTNDLSYARSNYPHRSIKVYLNNLANRVFVKLYRNRISGRRNIVKFWKESLPKVMYESRKALYLSFIVFAIAFGIGVFSSVQDGDFARQVLGDSYIEMTEDFIEEGDPMGVYKDMNQVDMFSYIALNNLLVSFRVFIMGVLFAIGTVWQMIFEGIRLGAFQYFFIERGLFKESFFTIWMHGAPEISSIILAGAAGITLGGGLMFPGTYRRGEAFLKGARRGVMIMLGIMPILLFAALIEGFVTRLTDIPNGIRGLIIFSNFAVIIYYFVIYPLLKYHHKDYKAFEDQIPESHSEALNFNIIRRSGEIYTVVFQLFGKHIVSLLKWSAALVVPYLLFLWYFPNNSIVDIMGAKLNFNMFDNYLKAITQSLIGKVVSVFDYESFPILYGINSLLFAFVGTIILYYFQLKELPTDQVHIKGKTLGEFLIRNVHKVAIFMYAFNLIFFAPSGVMLIAIFFFMPMVALFIFIAVYENCNPVTAMIHGVRMIRTSFGTMLGYNIMIVLISFIMLIFFNSEMIMRSIENIFMVFNFDDRTYSFIVYSIFAIIAFMSIGILLGPLFYAAATYYFSVDEKQTAKSLREDIEKIGKSRKAYGLPTEE